MFRSKFRSVFPVSAIGNYFRSPPHLLAVAVVEILGTVIQILSLGVVAGGYIAACWSPFLLVSSLRGLFELGPTTDWSSNYLLASVAVGTTHVGVLVVLLLVPMAPVMALFYAGLGLAACWMAVAGVALPGTGRHWIGEADWFGAGIELLAGAFWYALVTTIPPFVVWTMVLARF